MPAARGKPGSDVSTNVPEASDPLDSAGVTDALNQFIAQRCTVSLEASITARDLYIAYLRWCDESDEAALLQRQFGLALTHSGYQRRRRGGGRHWWVGIGLAGDAD